MFVSHEVSVEARFEEAALRLTRLVSRGGLHAPCEAAYENGFAVMVRVGPFGGIRGLSKLVRVCLLPPVRHGRTLTIPLRWEATGAAGELFPVLDADLILAADGDDQTRLALTGAYRPPFGRTGAALDKAIMRTIATTTIRSLLEDIAQAAYGPDGQAVTPAARTQPASGPQAS